MFACVGFGPKVLVFPRGFRSRWLDVVELLRGLPSSPDARRFCLSWTLTNDYDKFLKKIKMLTKMTSICRIFHVMRRELFFVSSMENVINMQNFDETRKHLSST